MKFTELITAVDKAALRSRFPMIRKTYLKSVFMDSITATVSPDGSGIESSQSKRGK